MGTQVIVTDVDAEATASFYAVPVWDGLLGWFFISDTRDKARRNLRGDRNSAVVVGAPTFDSESGSFQGNEDFLQTDIEETEAMTIFAVIRSDDTRVDVDHMPMFYGTYQSPAAIGGGNTFGVALHVSQTALRSIGARGTSTADDTFGLAQIGGTDVTDWQLIRHEVEAGTGVNRLYNRTTNQSANSGTAAPRLRSTGKFRIGSGYSEYGGSCRVRALALFDRVLSAEESAAVEADIRRELARRGITV